MLRNAGEAEVSIEAELLPGLDRERFVEMTRPSEQGAGEVEVVTLLMPMERKGAETRKNRIVFKNALNDAMALCGPAMQKQLEQLRVLDQPTEEFWQFQEDGLAMVIRETEPVKAYLTPFPVGPFVSCGREPYLSPLLRMVGALAFDVLVMDLNELRLFRATRWHAQEIELQGLPTSLAEAMQYDDPEQSLQGHSAGGGMIFHGHGGTGDEVRNQKIARFFEMVDNGIPKNLASPRSPLLLLGPDDETGLYRTINQYPSLCDEVIRFNASNLRLDELRDMIRSWIGEREDAQLAEDLGRIPDFAAAGKASTDFNEIAAAIGAGRVATLFVQNGEHHFGRWDSEIGALEVHAAPEPGDEELIGKLATRVATTSGTVRWVDRPPIPAGGPLAALYHY